MGSMKDLLIDAPCHWCGREEMLTLYATTIDGNAILLCDICRCRLTGGVDDLLEEMRSQEERKASDASMER